MRSKLSSKLTIASCVLCDTPIARIITVCVSSLRIQVGDSPRNYNNSDSVACTRVNRVIMLINLCAETIKPVFEGDKYYCMSFLVSG